VINEDLTLDEGAVLPWGTGGYYHTILEVMCEKKNIPLNVPYKKLSTKQKENILYGGDTRYEVHLDGKKNYG